MRRLAAALPLMLVIASLTGCGGSDPSASSSAISGTITVAAAQSLASAFTDIAKAFEASHRGVTVRLNFGGSSALVAQVQQGAPADVFASADTVNMQKLLDGDLTVGSPQRFARNRLAIAVPRNNPKHIEGLADLAQPGLVVSLCAPEVPCGNYARAALAKAGVTVNPKSTETSVAGVVGRIVNGEADAGIVYETDVRAASKLESVVIPAAENVVAEYPIAVLESSANRKVASAFVAFVGAAEAQSILRRYGFEP